jgi:hypothetical protein
MRNNGGFWTKNRAVETLDKQITRVFIENYLFFNLTKKGATLKNKLQISKQARHYVRYRDAA